MDVGTLSSEAAQLIAPYLPALISQGTLITGKALEEIGKQVGSSTWATVKELWETVHPSLDNAEGRKTLESIAQQPDVAQRSDALQSLLTQTMTANPGSQVQIAKAIQNISHSSNITINVS
jgi:hypothetical protein